MKNTNIDTWYEGLSKAKKKQLQKVYNEKNPSTELMELMYWKNEFDESWNSIPTEDINIKSSVGSIHKSLTMVRYSNKKPHGKNKPKETIKTIKMILYTISNELDRVKKQIEQLQSI